MQRMDMDLVKERGEHSLRLSAPNRDALLHQLAQDSALLKQHNLMDYSVLLGIMPLKDLPNPSAIKKNSTPQLSMPLLEANQTSEDREVYFIGVIDILQKYNLAKKYVVCCDSKVLHSSCAASESKEHGRV